MNRRIVTPPWPVYSNEERAAVDQILCSGKTNYWTGIECKNFESEFAERHGMPFGIALANGTLALELALQVLSVGAGDEVIVTPRSFFASASCIVRLGATPVFADVDLDSQNITPQSIEAVITPNTKAIIAVHLAGWPCDMPGIMSLASKHDLLVIEDCAQAHGASIGEKPIGSFGHAAAFSFCQDKIMSTAGEGGMLLLNDETLWEAAWAFKDHGKSFKKVNAKNHPPGFRWLHESFGTNWRMTEIQAAIGRIQLRKLDEWIHVRQRNAMHLHSALSEIEALRTPLPSAEIEHAYYKYYVFVEDGKLANGWGRDRVLGALEEKGFPGLSGSCPEIYREEAFASSPMSRLPNAKRLGEESIMLLVHPGISSEHLDPIVDAFHTIMTAAS